jgi:Zinc-finger associated domain (zf-AD)/Zinc-finger of C2H2 type
MNVENKVDNICRCCLVEEDNMKNMLIEMLVGPERVNFIEAYRICAGLKDLDEDIAMYKQVCATCEYKLKVSYDFRELCQSSAKTLKERSQYQMADVKMEALSDGEDEPVFLYNTFDQAAPTRQANHFNQVFLTDKSSQFKVPPPIVSQIKSEETKPMIRKEVTAPVATMTVREPSPVVETKPKIEKQVEPPDGPRSDEDDDFDNNDECFAEPDIEMEEDAEDTEKKTKRRKQKDPDTAVKVKRNRSKRQLTDYEPDDRLDVSTIEASYMCYYCDVFLNTHKDYLEHRENHKTENISNRLARQCFVCNEMVPGYIKHLEEVHREFRPNACKICQVKFQSQNALKNHLYIHCTANAFQCLGCNKKFKTQNQRRSHIIKEKHSSNKYHCPVCGLGTLEFITLHEHFTNEHLNAFSKQLFPCYKCKKVFSFNKHVLKHECSAPAHQWPTDPSVKMQLYKCDKCDQEFRDNDEMVRFG